MTVLVLDPRWPDQIPIAAIGRLRAPVEFSSEVPISVRWDFDVLLDGAADSGGAESGAAESGAGGTFVTTERDSAAVRDRVEAGEQLIVARSLDDSVYQAQTVMRRANRIGEWEAAQTHQSLLPYLEEETREFAQAVRAGANDAELLSELGDVFLQVLFHAEIASRRGAFDLSDVAASFVAKMRSRSPYLFDGTDAVVPVEEQERLWAEGKAREGKEKEG